MHTSIKIILLSLTVSLQLLALDVPKLTGHVVDKANILSIDQKLEQYLADYERGTGHQIAVLTVTSLEGEAIDSYSMRVAEAWQLGSKDKDDGVLLLIAANDHKLRIEVGYGLEGSLTDYQSGNIIRNRITPYFKQNQYDQGVVSGIKSIVSVIGGKAVGERYSKKAQAKQTGSPFILFIIIAIFLRVFRRNPLMGALFLGSMMGGGRRGGGFGGGGFGGFSGGGGGFGGGGASGSW